MTIAMKSNFPAKPNMQIETGSSPQRGAKEQKNSEDFQDRAQLINPNTQTQS